MRRVFLVHWHAKEIKERVLRLRTAGYAVETEAEDGAAAMRAIGRNPPEAIVIDLSRIPSHGRYLGQAVRTQKRTRHVPLVFVDGESEKVARVRTSLPDATYTTWRRYRGALKKAIARPPKDPVVPKSRIDSGPTTSLAKKLGIRPNTVVALSSAPPDFERTLGPVPEGVNLRRAARGRCDQVIWFTRTRKDLQRKLRRMSDLAGRGGLWIAWPKMASGVSSDLKQSIVREVGLAAGLVDYKICSIDDTWSGLRFAKRKPQGQPRRA